VQLSEEKLAALTARLTHAAENTLRRAEQQWQLAAGRLEAVSPVAILQRGYALAYRGDTLVRQAESLHPGDTLNIRFSEGSITATVNDVTPDHGGDTDEI
jgi:exodeoxyribonuclease VII large subunit